MSHGAEILQIYEIVRGCPSTEQLVRFEDTYRRRNAQNLESANSVFVTLRRRVRTIATLGNGGSHTSELLFG